MAESVKKKVIVIGGGGHAKQIMGTLLRRPEYEVMGFLDDNTDIQEIFGLPNLGGVNPPPIDLPTKTLALGIGHVGKFAFRKKLIEDYKNAGYSFETVISPTAIIVPYGVEIGEGAYIADLAILEPDVKIGKYAIINNTACINHETSVGDNTHIAPGVMVSGNVIIGNDVMLGTGSSIVQGVIIENECLIGMGVTIIKNCKKGQTYSIFNSK